jgi:hypothetical protein
MEITIYMIHISLNDATFLRPRSQNRPPPPSDAMKFLLKVVVLVVAARFVLHTPQGGSSPIDRVNDMTVRDITHHVDTVFARIGATLKSMLS